MIPKIWIDNPELQQRYEKILIDQQRLQKLLGVEPKTLEQRWKEFQQRQAEQEQARAELERQKQELAKLQSIRRPALPLRRPQ